MLLAYFTNEQKRNIIVVRTYRKEKKMKIAIYTNDNCNKDEVDALLFLLNQYYQDDQIIHINIAVDDSENAMLLDSVNKEKPDRILITSGPKDTFATAFDEYYPINIDVEGVYIRAIGTHNGARFVVMKLLNNVIMPEYNRQAIDELTGLLYK